MCSSLPPHRQDERNGDPGCDRDDQCHGCVGHSPSSRISILTRTTRQPTSLARSILPCVALTSAHVHTSLSDAANGWTMIRLLASINAHASLVICSRLPIEIPTRLIRPFRVNLAALEAFCSRPPDAVFASPNHFAIPSSVCRASIARSWSRGDSARCR